MKKKQSFFRQVVTIYDKESPEFFKRLFRFGRVLVAGGMALIAPEVILPNVTIPNYLLIIAGNVVVAGVVIMAVSKAATKSEDDDKPAPKPNEDE